ncbi:FtsW/RodA/SpoVE family cell cycle protein [Terrilactibacillus sp. S3-3]|nr:FtsW/RodA/SpoVE family cell cycle protein [Terrilactibacillus sp. S3-3]
MKLFLIFSLGATIEKHNEMYPVRGVHEDLLLLGKIALISLPPLGLIFIQPDLGTALVMFSIIVAVTLVSGIRWQFVATMFSAIALGLAVFFISWFKFPWLVDIVLKSHQKERFLAWFEPYKYTNSYGYQLINALNSIGSGQVFSKALDKSISFPEAYNDFIFAVIGGSFGFIGAATVITLFFLMIYRIVHAAIETHDPFGSYVCTGIIGMFMFQVFENIGMTIQVMPVTGITLPFISYGGSSLLTSMISIGLVLSIQSRTRKYMFT